MRPAGLLRGASGVLVLVLAGCVAHTARAGSGPPGATATPRSRPSATPIPTPAAAPAATPNPAPARTNARATPPADPLPYILRVSLSPTVVSSGTTVSASVRTTPGVVSVMAYAGGASMRVPRTGAGLFSASTSLPPLPSFVHGVYPVAFVASDRRGRTTQAAVNVTVP